RLSQPVFEAPFSSFVCSETLLYESSQNAGGGARSRRAFCEPLLMNLDATRCWLCAVSACVTDMVANLPPCLTGDRRSVKAPQCRARATSKFSAPGSQHVPGVDDMSHICAAAAHGSRRPAAPRATPDRYRAVSGGSPRFFGIACRRGGRW